jgi:nicotinamide riboside kinase
MKIGLCGTVSVGKSTLVNELHKLDTFKDYKIATERSKYLRDQGITLNTDSTIKGQFVFAAERSLELLNDNIITDRTIYDVCAFTMSATSISWENKIKLIESFLTIKDEYDIIIYVSPEGVDIEDNGVRTTDPIYRDKIDFAIQGLLAQYPPKKLIKIQGSTEDRINSIISQIN